MGEWIFLFETFKLQSRTPYPFGGSFSQKEAVWIKIAWKRDKQAHNMIIQVEALEALLPRHLLACFPTTPPRQQQQQQPPCCNNDFTNRAAHVYSSASSCRFLCICVYH